MPKIMTVNSHKKIKLGQLQKGKKGKILSVNGNGLATRFLEMGFLEGETVELLHEAPFGKDPVAIRVRGSLIALRRQEANYIEVEEVGHG